MDLGSAQGTLLTHLTVKSTEMQPDHVSNPMSTGHIILF